MEVTNAILSLPEDWKDKRVVIHLGAVKSAFYIWVNGKKVGYSEGSKTPAEFDLTLTYNQAIIPLHWKFTVGVMVLIWKIKILEI